MSNLLFDYKRIWLRIKKEWYDFRYFVTDEDIVALILFLLIISLLGFFLGIMQLVIFYCIPILILEYVIFKFIYLHPIIKVYRKSYKHGEAQINHKIFKSCYKLYEIKYNWEINYISNLKLITKIEFFYKNQPINVGFFDFIFTYNKITREILQNYISDIKRKLNLVENKKQKIVDKQKSKENTKKLYTKMLKDIQEMQKKEND